MTERCNEVFDRLDSRCILKSGHDGKHAFPNALLKKEQPDVWQDLRQSEKYWDNSPLPTVLKIKGQIDEG
jgi:hypothetical protein